MINLKYLGPLYKKTGKKEDEFEKVNNIKALLNEIKKKYDNETYKIAKSSLILINGENIGNEDGFKTKLSDGDVVKFVPVCGGG